MALEPAWKSAFEDGSLTADNANAKTFIDAYIAVCAPIGVAQATHQNARESRNLGQEAQRKPTPLSKSSPATPTTAATSSVALCPAVTRSVKSV